MSWPTGLQFYYVIADPKVGEQHIYRNYFKWSSFQVTTDLLNSENLKIVIYFSAIPWATHLHFYYVIANSKVYEKDIYTYTKFSKCKGFKVTTDLLNWENLKVAIAQVYNELQVCNFTMLQLTQK